MVPPEEGIGAGEGPPLLLAMLLSLPSSPVDPGTVVPGEGGELVLEQEHLPP